MLSVKKYLDDFSHLFFPHTCEGCGTDIIERTNIICAQCFSSLPETNFFTFPENPVAKTFYGRLKIANAGSAFYFTKDSLIQHLLIQLKYRGNKDVGILLGKLAGLQIKKSTYFKNVDVIIPLPLNKKKESQRGYNQALLISKGMAEILQKPIDNSAVIRAVFTETQTHQNRVNRWQNMEDVFQVSIPQNLSGKHILLVDDVITTGATLEACGSKILQIEGTQLSIATVAYTL